MSAIGDSCTDCALVVQNMSKMRGVKIGKEMQERLKSDINVHDSVHDDRVNEKEKDWMKKVDCLDETHTKAFKLTVKEADRLITKLEAFATGGDEIGCSTYKKKVLSCLKENKDDSFQCNDMVEQFSKCVDDMMFQSTRKDCGNTKKPTYTQKFQQL